MYDGWDDEQLMAALRESMRARQAVPDWFVDMGKSAYAWHNIDAELAQLTYDSSRDTERAAVVRSENASIRALTFASPRLSWNSRFPGTRCSARSSRRRRGRSRRIPGRA